ncbi:MAG TPA: prolyl oligopeptidase family serine peptidase, partial [Pyrinomonadaceae bacterium]|nr:prolyl oligopeptidase family serine peptidase [Pyrinomonadaceae bacterium]
MTWVNQRRRAVFSSSRFFLYSLNLILGLICFQPAGHGQQSAVKPVDNSMSQPTSNSKFNYPAAKRVEQWDDYHGTKVQDPYRWLEDPAAADSRQWIEAENKLTFSYLEQIPQRAQIKARLQKLWNYEKYGVPFKRGDRYFLTKNDGLQNQSVLYSMKALDGELIPLLDPNKLSADGTVALSGFDVSDDGRLLAYGLAASGSDWVEWRVRDVASGKDLDDHLKWVKFSGASWTKDNKGFYYSRYDEPREATKLEDANYYQKLYYHRVGTPQAEDRLVYERRDQKEWGFNGEVTDDGRYLIISVWEGTNPKNRVFYQDLGAGGAPIVELLPTADAAYNFLGNDGPVFYFRTDLESPRGRVIAIDTRRGERANWRELIAQTPETLESASVAGDVLIAAYLKDANTRVKTFKLDGTPLREVTFPELGTAGGFSGRRKDTETFYSFTNFTRPPSIYRYDLRSGATTLFRQPKLEFRPEDYETKQIFYASKDGTRVPMFITHKKGIKLDGSNPTYLYGYGGFTVSLTPAFSPANLVWMEMGGVFAMPNLRGGGEYGEEWHLAGTKARKQNVFDDFLAAAEWLIANKYTSSPKLAIGGGSNGGLLVGAALTQRPDLFGAALPAVGVMDMVRFQKFTIGWAWTSDYGSSDNAEDFKALYAYSPLHKIKPG